MALISRTARTVLVTEQAREGDPADTFHVVAPIDIPVVFHGQGPLPDYVRRRPTTWAA